MEVSLEAVMVELDAQFFDNVLDNEQPAVLDCLLEGPLDVPKHQVLQLRFLCEQLLEAIEVSLYGALEHGASPGHEFHEGRPVSTLQSLDLSHEVVRVDLIEVLMSLLCFEVVACCVALTKKGPSSLFLLWGSRSLINLCSTDLFREVFFHFLGNDEVLVSDGKL